MKSHASPYPRRLRVHRRECRRWRAWWTACAKGLPSSLVQLRSTAWAGGARDTRHKPACWGVAASSQLSRGHDRTRLARLPGTLEDRAKRFAPPDGPGEDSGYRLRGTLSNVPRITLTALEHHMGLRSPHSEPPGRPPVCPGRHHPLRRPDGLSAPLGRPSGEVFPGPDREVAALR